jgi:phenol 2-monooxygenase (NADPH)
MQYHHDGFRTGDPDLSPPGREVSSPLRDGDEVDVLVVGTGPAGLVLAAQLAHFPEIDTRVVERREGPLLLGQADGVACRTVEMFEAFGLSERLLRESYWVNETVFWRPDDEEASRIVRTGRIQDTEDGLSEFPHLIVNQARLLDLLLEHMAHSPTRLAPDYGVEVVDVVVDEQDEHPVRVSMQRGDERLEVRARYVVGCDGARSVVRRSMGVELHGDRSNTAWGVMDVLATTDFPDIRLKSVISSAAGNILLIPREGGHLVRIYIELDEQAIVGLASPRDISRDQLVDAVNRVMAPYRIDVKEFAWTSVYEVGQRLTHQFDDLDPDAPADAVPRVFIAGDACHTHSAKAGQGMNVSMQDGFNLGWKLAAVLRGHSPASLLRTYSSERQAVAQALIDFDKEWNEVLDTDPVRFQELFAQQGRYTAGVATRYVPGPLTGCDEHQHLAAGFVVGERFHSAPVVRVADARPMQLGHVARADGAWRLYAFADAAALTDPDSRLAALCDFLARSASSPLLRFAPPDTDAETRLDLRAILQQPHRGVDVATIATVLRPARGRLRLTDHEKVFSPDTRSPEGDVFDLRGIDRTQGALVVVRPDQHVAAVLPLDDGEGLASFLDRVLLPHAPQLARPVVSAQRKTFRA